MEEGHHRAIHDLLAERGLLAADCLADAWGEHEQTGRPFAEVLIARRLMAKEALLQAIAACTGHEYRAELPATLPGEAIAARGARLALAHAVAPLSIDGWALTVAAANPFAPDLVTELSFALDREVRVQVADPAHIQLLIGQHYGEGGNSIASDLGDLHAGVAEPSRATLTEADVEQLAGQAPVIRLVDLVLARAVRERASDVHFEPFEHEFRIRYRVDGVLRDLAPPPKHWGLPVVSRLKVLGNLNIAERRTPQDGRIRLKLEGRPVDLRISTLPTQFGESVVLRVLDRSAVKLTMDELGLPGPIQAGMEQAIRRPNGILVVTGPTGAGKTTTLYACLQALNAIDAKLLTVEDPVEYEIEGVMQVPVNLAAGLTFADALRAFLRQDPDVVMVGEIRDLETAQIAIQAALTGHLVLTTLHTNDAASAVTRLLDLGIEPFLLASTLEAVLAQRLLRRVCRACRRAYTPDESLLRQLDVDWETVPGRTFYAAQGCAACHHTGYQGRLGLFEFLPVTEPLRDQLVQGLSLVDLRRRAVAQGMVSLRAAGLQAILAGDTTVEEVIKYT